MSSDFAIKIENLSKCYQIYSSPRDRLKQFLLPWLQRTLRLQPRQYYREFWALHDISFEVKKGETVGIIGSNGSGKSTLLQLICGTLNPSAGSVKTNGRIAALLELGSGFNPEFTGRENVYLNCALLGLSKYETDACFGEIAAFADIGDFIERPVKSYSSGMYVRLAFAVQTMISPDILIIDEALAVGDERFQRKCFSRMEQLKANGTSILFVSHSPSIVAEFCDRAVFINRGHRVMYGEALGVMRAYQHVIYSPAKLQDAIIKQYSASDRESISDLTSNKIDLGHIEELCDSDVPPESMVIYPVQGAEIESISIQDEQQRKINTISSGCACRVVLRGRFVSECSGVFFAVHIRTVSGVVITGQRYPKEGGSLCIKEVGLRFEVCFQFNLNLLSGAYFVGGGVWSDSEAGCLHRILDAAMFRVVEGDRSGSMGYVDLSAGNASVEFLR